MKITSSLAKLYGELAELRFVLKCRELGLLVSKLVTELGRYDFLVDTGITEHAPSHVLHARRGTRRLPTADYRPPLTARLPAADYRLPILRVQVKSTAYQQPTSSRRKNVRVAQAFRPAVKGKKKKAASAAEGKPRPWRINLIWSARSQPYQPNDFDILAAYIHPLDLWYIIPTSAFAPVRQLLLSPDGLPRYRHWEQFRDRWDLLQQFGLALQSARTC